MPDPRTENEPPSAAPGDADRTRALPDNKGPRGGTGPDADAAGPRLDPPDHPGDLGRLGKYRVVRLLGRGGMGAVFLGYDPRLERKVALKVMLPAFAADRVARDRFLREARAAAGVRSDHVVAIYDVEDAGTPFIAMEYLQGLPLDEYLTRKGTPSVHQCLRVGREVALGLAAAHARGLVHRDVKPGNLWLEAPGGRVKLLDFGLARPQQDDVQLTKSGAVVGTPAYMSPEQARGERVDGRSDLFSLGGLMYRLLTGRLPFPGGSTLEVLTRLAVDEPAPVRSLNPAVPAPLAELVHALLAKDRGDRPGSAEEVAERLARVEQALAAGELTLADPTAGPADPGPGPAPPHAAAVGTGDSSIEVPSETEVDPPEPAKPAPPARPLRPRAAGLVVAGLAVLAAAGVGWRLLRPPAGPDPAATGRDEGPRAAAPGPPATPRAVDPAAPSAAGRERPAAEALRLHGAELTVRTPDGRSATVQASDRLPDGPFTVTRVHLSSRAPGGGNPGGPALVDAAAAMPGLQTIEDGNLQAGPSAADLARLAAAPCGAVLEKLEIGFVLTADRADALGGFPRLAHLRCKAPRADEQAFARLADRTRVARLFLIDYGRGGGSPDRAAAALHRLPLRTLELVNPGLTPAEAVRTAGGCPGLERFGLIFYPAADDALPGLAEACRRLPILRLYGSGVTDAGLGALAGLTHLQGLDLQQTKVTAAGVSRLKAALPGCRIDWDGGVLMPSPKAAADRERAAAEVFRGHGAELRVRTPDVATATVRPGDPLPGGPFAVTRVHLNERFPSGDAGGRVLVDALANLPELLAVVDSGGRTSPSADDLARLAAAPCGPRLEELVAGFPLTADRADVLKRFPKLTLLSCFAPRADEAAFARLAEVPALRHLVLVGLGREGGSADRVLPALHRLPLLKLELNAPGVPPADVARTAAGFPHLEGLIVSFYPAADETLPGLVRACPKLPQLGLYGSGVTDAGAASLAGLPQLQRLDLRQTKVTAAGVASVRAALPGCAVVWDPPKN